MKRLFDIFLSSIGLILFSPLFAAVSILIKLGSAGPIFFTQKRIGKNFKPFYLYKFRTMVQDAPTKGLSITVDCDPRITRIGRLLRKTKIDELPQLWNVLKGNMSLVGPRPEVRRYVSKYRKDYKEILKIRPGITDGASLIYSNEEAILKGKKDPEAYYIHILL
ncbi:MAG TPA: sugar transferase, partial [Candidatus Brocadiaceae bacterium]